MAGSRRGWGRKEEERWWYCGFCKEDETWTPPLSTDLVSPTQCRECVSVRCLWTWEGKEEGSVKGSQQLRGVSHRLKREGLLEGVKAKEEAEGKQCVGARRSQQQETLHVCAPDMAIVHCTGAHGHPRHQARKQATGKACLISRTRHSPNKQRERKKAAQESSSGGSNI